MAAGLGSRFGGLKQLEKLGPNGEFIIDYSIYDAKKAGFNKIVFVIKEENFKLFKETIGKRVEKIINVEYAFQDNSLIPKGFLKYYENRQKPLGTGHAILSAKDKIHEPFAVINADDFYGREAFLKASEILENLDEAKRPYEYAMVSYQVKNTLTSNGSVKRGVCEVKDNYLTNIIESEIEKIDNRIIATSLNEGNSFEIPEDAMVSMNLSLFTPSFFIHLENKFHDFLEKNKDNPDNCEFFMPDAIFSAIREEYAIVRGYQTTATWYGITYKEDKEIVLNALKKLTEDGTYPKSLWT